MGLTEIHIDAVTSTTSFSKDLPYLDACFGGVGNTPT